MFTGIIESLGEVTAIEHSGTNLSFWVESRISNDLEVDQSVSHNGVCLTVEELKPAMHKVTAVLETLEKTNLRNLKTGDIVNLERCLTLNSLLDGHIVQGHVDTIATCILKDDKEGSWVFRFSFPEQFAPLIIEKGSVCLNGISLTAFHVTRTTFSVTIIPYTYEHTNINKIEEGDTVNIEFDILGKYVNRIAELKENPITLVAP